MWRIEMGGWEFAASRARRLVVKMDPGRKLESDVEFSAELGAADSTPLAMAEDG